MSVEVVARRWCIFVVFLWCARVHKHTYWKILPCVLFGFVGNNNVAFFKLEIYVNSSIQIQQLKKIQIFGLVKKIGVRPVFGKILAEFRILMRNIIREEGYFGIFCKLFSVISVLKSNTFYQIYILKAFGCLI